MTTIHRLLTIACTAGILLLAGAGDNPDARAETVRATRKAKVMKRPGEQAAVVTRVADGDTMTVLAKQGRWVKVRANGRTGWVTRSSVAATRSARETTRNTRRRPFVDGRSTRRGWSGDAPDDRVGADAVDEEELEEEDDEEEEARPRKAKAKPKAKKATSRSRARDDEDEDEDEEELADDGDEEDDEEVADEDEDEAEEDEDEDGMVTVVADAADIFEKPNKRADTLLTVEAGEKLRVIRASDSGAWLLVENQDSDAGWVRAKDVSEPSSGFRRPKLAKWGGARLGYSAISSQFASNGNGELAAYGLSSAAAALVIGGQLDYVYSPKYMITADAQYTGSRAAPGIRYQNAAGAAADIAFTQHEVDVGIAGGYNFRNKRGMVAYARVGYHYGIFSVAGVEDLTKNLAHLPSEQLKGTTLGLILDVPKVTEKIAMKVGVQALYPLATRTQTVGLEDGATSKVFGAWGTANLAYQWKPSITLDAGYRYSYAKTDWLGAAPDSLRGHDATEAARKDVGHTVSLGLGKTF